MCKNEIIVSLNAIEEVRLILGQGKLLIAEKVLTAKYLTLEEDGKITKVKDTNNPPPCNKTPINLLEEE